MSNEKLLEILNERLAKGEITPSDYDELKARIMGADTRSDRIVEADHYETIEHSDVEPLADGGAEVFGRDGEYIVFVARSRLRFFMGVQILLSLYFGLAVFPENVMPIIREFIEELEFYNQIILRFSSQLTPIILETTVIFNSAILAGISVKVISQLLIANLTFFSNPVSRDLTNKLKELEKGAISSRMQDISKSYSGFVIVRMGSSGRFIYSVKALPLIVINGALIIIGTTIVL